MRRGAAGAIFKRIDGRPWGGGARQPEDDGEELPDELSASPVELCPTAGRLLLDERSPGRLARVLGEHVRDCPACRAGLEAPGPVEALPPRPVVARWSGGGMNAG